MQTIDSQSTKDQNNAFRTYSIIEWRQIYPKQ